MSDWVSPLNSQSYKSIAYEIVLSRQLAFGRVRPALNERTVVKNSRESGLKYSTNCSSVRSLPRTDYLLARSALLASFTRSAALTRLFARSLVHFHPKIVGKCNLNVTESWCPESFWNVHIKGFLLISSL